eukprot:scaffold389_cov382-Prasinococcus_capsulatus_cf.AAC.23
MEACPTLMSIWKAVTPSAVPATLKSMSPRASSEPRISLSTTALLFGPSGIRRPIATPATGALMGTPASCRARQPPHTVAIDELPLLSVTRDSSFKEYLKSPRPGRTGFNARSASMPCPTSRRPGAPTRPHSPTLDGGKE